MKRIALFVFGVLMVSTNAFSQSPADPIEKALLAAPENLRADATVIK